MSTEQDIKDILEVVNFIKDNAVMKNDFEARMTGVENRMTGVENRMTGVENRMIGIEKRLTKVESQMVTKDYLDEKMADLRGDLVVLVRKEDTKLKTLIDILEEKRVITKNEALKIMKMEPFAQLAV